MCTDQKPLSAAPLFDRKNVHVWDRDPLKRQLASKDGFLVVDEHKQVNGIGHQYNYVLGAAGRQSLSLQEITGNATTTDSQKRSLPLLADGCVLISCSSGTIEFPFNELVALGLPARIANASSTASSSVPSTSVLDSKNIHQNVTFRLRDGRYVVFALAPCCVSSSRMSMLNV
jgi:hypothetical protein